MKEIIPDVRGDSLMDTWQVCGGGRANEDVTADALEVRVDGRLVFVNWVDRARNEYAIVRVIAPTSYADVIRLQPKVGA